MAGGKQQADWRLFEHEMRDLVEAFGYRAEATSPIYDFGVDVIAHSKDRTVVIQCKLYGTGRIGGETMMKLVGSRTYFKATDAICITTSKFTKQAQDIAEKEDIKLVDCEKLILLCREQNLTIPSLTVLTIQPSAIIEITETEMRIGRQQNNQIVLSSSLVSRHHAQLSRNKLTLCLKDNASTNGTNVNGHRLIAPAILNYGDVISICGTELTVYLRTPTGKLCS